MATTKPNSVIPFKSNKFGQNVYAMITDTQKRQQILSRIYRMPLDKLTELDNFLSKLELEMNKKSKNLSFAGAWQDLDDSLFSEFTDDLISKRESNNRRNNE